MHTPRRPLRGFTLVELALVFATLGLLIGGVLTGQTMLKNQRLMSINTDAMRYMMAKNQFKEKYGYAPGDFPTATAIWGRADGGSPVTSNCAAPASTASVGDTTCNGNGNGYIESFTEEFRAWQQLVAAKYLQGVYTGIKGPGVNFYTLGGNVPKGEAEGSGFTWQAGWGNVRIVDNAAAADIFHYDGDYTDSLTYAGQKFVTGAWVLILPLLTPAELAQLDTKADDGNPTLGSTRTIKINADAPSFCATGAGPYAYNISYATPTCVALYMQTFGSMNNNR